MLEALSLPAVASALKAHPEWTLDADRPAIHRSFRFADFTTAWGFMSQCALHAERAGHHPEWSNVWATVEVTLTTHDAGGISQLDLDFAAFMDRAAAQLTR